MILTYGAITKINTSEKYFKINNFDFWNTMNPKLTLLVPNDQQLESSFRQGQGNTIFNLN